MNIHARIAACVLAGAAGTAMAAPVLQGTTVTGSVSGASNVLLGLADGYAEVAGATQATTPVSGAFGDIEFLTGDFALGIDFDEWGHVAIIDNTGGALIDGTYTFTFSFAGLAAGLGDILDADLSALAAGSVSFARLDLQAIQVTVSNVQFATPFGSVTAQLAVPEPGSAALALAGMALLARVRSRSRRGS